MAEPRKPMPIPRMSVPTVKPAPRSTANTIATIAPSNRTISPFQIDCTVSVRERINLYELNQKLSTMNHRNSGTMLSSSSAISTQSTTESRPVIAERKSVLNRLPWLENVTNSAAIPKTPSNSSRPTMRLIRDLSAVYHTESLHATGQRTDIKQTVSHYLPSVQVPVAVVPLTAQKSIEHLEFTPLRKRVEDLMMNLEARAKTTIPISMNITLNCL